MPEEFIQVITTTDSKDEADRLARGAVEARLAACVQVGTVTSTYWWKGEIENADEHILIMKTARRLYGPLAEFIKRQHSYEVPEITAVSIVEGSDDYLGWISAETAEPSPTG